jgi:fatty acid desaturase
VAAVVTLLGGWQVVLMYWIVPAFTWLKWTMYLRGVAEHHALEGGGESFASSRTTLPSWLGRWLIAPQNVHFHLDHHLYPSVPCFRLPELHRELMKDPAYATRAHITHGYLAVLAECVGYRPRPAGRPA